MKFSTYLIFGKEDSTDYTIIKEGFSLPAALFNGWWALYKGIWWLFVFHITITIVNMRAIPEEYHFLVPIASFMLYGFLAIDFFEFELKRKGYKLINIITAYSEEEAEVKFLSNRHNHNQVLNHV